METEGSVARQFPYSYRKQKVKGDLDFSQDSFTNVHLKENKFLKSLFSD